MYVILLINQLGPLNTMEKVLWSIAMVATGLLVILEVLNFLGLDRDFDRKSDHSLFADARTVLLFFTFFGWSSILAHLWIAEWPSVLLIGIPTGLITAALPRVLVAIRKKKQRAVFETFKMDEALTSTGEVLAFIPSGRGGKGKVHLNLRSAPYQVDAVSNGQDLPVGAPVRVVEIVDGRVLVVEPLTGGSTPPDLPSN